MVSKDINWSIYHLPELVHPCTEEEYVILLVYQVKKTLNSSQVMIKGFPWLYFRGVQLKMFLLSHSDSSS